MALIDNLISYWKLDGNSNDAVGSNNGTDTDITYSSGNGKIIQGAGFNGTSSKIALGDVAAFRVTPTTPFSMQAWVKHSLSTNARIIGKRDAFVTGVGYDIFVSSAATGIRFELANNAGGGIRADYANYLNDNAWHHLVGTYDGSGNGSGIILYVDGSNVASGSGTITGDTDDGDGFFIGVRDDTNQYFTGAVDETAWWSRELTSSEVAELYNNGTGLQYPFVSGVPIINNLTLLGVG